MISKFAVAAVLAVATAGPAYAASVVTTPGSTTSFAPTPGLVVDFNSGVPASFALTTSGTAGIVQGNSPTFYAQPAYSDGSRYLAVQAGASATLQGAVGYNSVSFFLGSIDTFNSVSLLDTAGNLIQSFSGSDFIIPANGNQSLPLTNRRVTITRGALEAQIGGIRFASRQNALEVDNVVFAVPEPTTWAMMFVGFGMMGASMRYRRRSTKFVTA
ncbi:Npun_F0296 family exosortase-dependent surface protein [Sphingomonas sp. Tas61C01]|uniref:Npun_F0296 family exosortase-dependent surface protein n=1 Tax=Sphingomonas sp. Tas61C01 TaxID=3458297 RepID=UPI00403EE511